MRAHLDTLDSMVQLVTRLLFADLGFPLQAPTALEGPGAPFVPGETVAGIIGFTGMGLRGSVAIQTTRRVLLATLPTGSPRSEAALFDWAAELANMVAGRLKNRLLRLGGSVDVALPVSARGLDLRLSVSPGVSARTQMFECAGGFIVVRLDAAFSDAFELKAEATAAEVPAIAEGEILLF